MSKTNSTTTIAVAFFFVISQNIFAQEKLFEISKNLVKEIKSRYVNMGDMLVPLSMALLTEYNEEYLGVGEKPEEKGEMNKSRRK